MIPITIIDTFAIKGRGIVAVFNQEHLPREPTVGAIMRQGGNEWMVEGVDRYAIRTRMREVGVLFKVAQGAPQPVAGEATIQLVATAAVERA